MSHLVLDPVPDDVAEILGLAAYTDLGAFALVGGQASVAPEVEVRQRLAGLAVGVLRRQRAALDLAARYGSEEQATLSRFQGLLDDFDARTTHLNWWEAVVKAYVGHAVAGDLCRTAALGLTGPVRDEVVAVLDGAELDRGLAELLAEGTANDPVLASRLALWGRRVVGEALGVAQRVLREDERLLALVAAAGGVPAADAQSWVFARLTAEHTRRMDRLGLTA
ncbi:ferritin-like fold-containing protein [Antribacter gilvus]|uniref:ferritin-like fold-containing protein n=1 Tax=Antribacter gilvus TaxID=2304675 RepID=UPI0013DF96F9|nr:ferritin-like fold-containing protein [Antribacter gilvus]